MPVRHLVLRRLVVALFGLAVVAGTAGFSVGSTEAASSKITWVHAKIIRWVDGDTVVTDHGRIRLIGVDTPETGRCGAATATKLAKSWAPAGSAVSLGNPRSVRDTDRYGRSLRYVVRIHNDISKSQIIHGAAARYDSTDGYQWHPRQNSYHQTDRAHKNYSCKAQKKPGKGFATKPIGYNCPKSAPIKGNRPSHIYHMPGQRFYKVTHPEVCFSTESAARAAGYRKSKV